MKEIGLHPIIQISLSTFPQFPKIINLQNSISSFLVIKLGQFHESSIWTCPLNNQYLEEQDRCHLNLIKLSVLQHFTTWWDIQASCVSSDRISQYIWLKSDAGWLILTHSTLSLCQKNQIHKTPISRGLGAERQLLFTFPELVPPNCRSDITIHHNLNQVAQAVVQILKRMGPNYEKSIDILIVLFKEILIVLFKEILIVRFKETWWRVQSCPLAFKEILIGQKQRGISGTDSESKTQIQFIQ